MMHFTYKHLDAFIIFLLQVKKSSSFCFVHTFQMMLLEEYGNVFCWKEFPNSYPLFSKISFRGWEFRVKALVCQEKNNLFIPLFSYDKLYKVSNGNVVDNFSFSIHQMAITVNVNKRIIYKYRAVSIIVEIVSENGLPSHCLVLTLLYYVYCCWY